MSDWNDEFIFQSGKANDFIVEYITFFWKAIHLVFLCGISIVLSKLGQNDGLGFQANV
jgi:hypothetical protein